MTTERTQAGEQFVLAGAERVGLAELARRRAAAPLKPATAQRPCDVGLFSDQAAQVDLVDLARKPVSSSSSPAPAIGENIFQPYTIDRARPLLILPCSEVKRPAEPDEWFKFADLYDGPTWRQWRASGFPRSNVAAISALYGYLEPGMAICTYNRRMDGDRLQSFMRVGDHVGRLAADLRRVPSAFCLGSALYCELVRHTEHVYPELRGKVAYASGTYLQQRRQLREWLEGQT